MAPETEHVCWAAAAEGRTPCLVVDLPESPLEEFSPGSALPPFRGLGERAAALAHLLRVESASGCPGDPLAADTLGRRVREYLDANSWAALTPEAIAAAAAASVAHLPRGFPAEYGTSVVVVVHDRRLDAAADLLATKDLTVSEIAIRTGFGSPSHLALPLARRFGSSPSRYGPGQWSRSGDHLSRS